MARYLGNDHGMILGPYDPAEILPQLNARKYLGGNDGRAVYAVEAGNLADARRKLTAHLADARRKGAAK
jgi:hypothetical protein